MAKKTSIADYLDLGTSTRKDDPNPNPLPQSGSHQVPPASASGIQTRISVTLPDELVSRYLELSGAAGVSLDDYVADRLTRCVSHTSPNAIYLSGEERAVLCRALAANLQSGAQLVERTVAALAVTVEGELIRLSPQLLLRIKDRAAASRTTLGDFLRAVVVEELERYAGLR